MKPHIERVLLAIFSVRIDPRVENITEFRQAWMNYRIKRTLYFLPIQPGIVAETLRQIRAFGRVEDFRSVLNA